MADIDVVAVLRRMSDQAARHRYPASLLREPPVNGYAPLDRETRDDEAAIAAVVELIAADVEYDAAYRELAAVRDAKGAWNVNPVPYSHPASIRMQNAAQRRRAALAACKPAPAEGGA